MAAESLSSLFFNAFLTNNFVLAMFLGLCPFLGTSAKKETALNMGAATTCVIVISSICAYGLNTVLKYYQLEFLRLISYIAVIAAAVQLVEMVLKKTSPLLSRTLGIYLPLITTNCAVLGVALIQTNKGYNFLQALVFSFGAGSGFALALLLMAGLREKLELANLPSVAQSAGLSMILAGILSLTFMGFAGLGS
jgi:Na+-translocating ferredoxin:NAD+ oxidoreductase subunit A